MGSSNHARGVFYALVAAFMWSILAIALKVSLSTLSSMSIVWIRFSIAFVLLAAYLLYKRRELFIIFRKPPVKLIIAAACLGCNYIGFMKGVENTSPSISQVFIQLGPVLFALAGIVMLHEKVNLKQKVGFAIVLLGLSLFYYEHFTVMEDTKALTIGVLWVLFGAVSWALYAILQKQLSQKYSTHQLNLFIYAFCTLILIPLIPFSEFKEVTPGYSVLLLFLGVNTLIAYGAIAVAFKLLEANKVSVIITLNPIGTFILMYFITVFDFNWIAPEHFSIPSIIGAILALGGGVLVILFSKQTNTDIS
jgi:drug/metabolite transporter (DMT)-like permease